MRMDVATKQRQGREEWHPTVQDNNLIAEMYGAVGEEARWTEVLDAIKLRLGVASAVFQRLVADKDVLVPVISQRDSWSTREAPRHDAWANSLHNPRFRRDTEPRDLFEIDSDHRNIHFSPADREALRIGLATCGLGAGFWLGYRTAPDEHISMVLHRHAGDDRDMTDADMEFLRQLQPHFQQLSGLIATMADYKARLSVTEAFMDSTSLALVTCNRNLGIHWINRAAEALVADLPQLSLVRDRLCFRSSDARADVRAVIAGEGGDTCRIMGDKPAQVLHLRVLKREAAGRQRWGRNLTLFALCSPGTAPQIDPGEVTELFGLTTAEATLATHLVGGMTVKDYAAHRGIAEGTARMQLKSALAKAEVSRQADLVRQICQSLARL
ncbi:helix-turn-helix transcriptional regulator [Altererythrobacter sp.]|uniref:helix-turn-helix transcriptional regulator n=1 Tax=Altererythrobacter sp. TaxID=1872480 RepID=UPI003D126792